MIPTRIATLQATQLQRLQERIAALMAEGTVVHALMQGESDLPTPGHIVEAGNSPFVLHIDKRETLWEVLQGKPEVYYWQKSGIFENKFLGHVQHLCLFWLILHILQSYFLII